MIDNQITIPEQGRIFAIKGDTASTATMLISLAERLARARVLFIDAAHCFNQLFVKKNYHKHDLELDGIFIARPFTPMQFESIINNLKNTIVEHKARAIIISGFDRFLQGDEYLADHVIEELAAQTKRHDCITLIGLRKESSVDETVLKHVQLCTRI